MDFSPIEDKLVSFFSGPTYGEPQLLVLDQGELKLFATQLHMLVIMVRCKCIVDPKVY